MTTRNSGGTTAESDTKIIHFGHDELVIRQRYEIISIANDVLIGIWFLIGTIFFFYSSMVYWGTWLFLLGSIEMLIRPTIRLVRRLHIQKYHPQLPGSADAGHDF